MSPLRRRALRFAEHYPNTTVLVIVGLFVLYGLIGALALYRVQQTQDALKHDQIVRDYKLCVVGNSSRQALVDVLQFAKMRVQLTAKANGSTPEQVRAAVAFYDAALAKIHIIQCPPPPVE